LNILRMHDSVCRSQKIIQPGALFTHVHSSDQAGVTTFSEFRSKVPRISLTAPRI
jgi:hypothetical protein